MATISILDNTLRPSADPRLDDTAFGAERFSWQDLVHSMKAGPGEVMTAENLLLTFFKVATLRNSCFCLNHESE